MEKRVGSLQEQALKRKERLKALRDRQHQGRAPEDGEPESKRALEESEAEDRHRFAEPLFSSCLSLRAVCH